MSALFVLLAAILAWFISLVTIVAGAYFVFPRRER